MPYGISKSMGGDSPSNDAHAEKVVDALVSRGYDKITAIKIMKAQMKKRPKKWHEHLVQERDE